MALGVHHKSIRWQFVIHGCIDGFSRKIMFFHCNANNRAGTVLYAFQNPVVTHGLALRVHGD